ncbi:hypothetical protein [Microbacterium sp. KR10-403]|uniref:hypothetical protein n=1 Tax=Microbacterium sp. KR10-403 TaxID=3158581 RepID=UPI0032E3FAE9
MGDKKQAEAQRYDREVRRVYLRTAKSYHDLTLGDLRKVVAAAEGMGDSSEVTFEGLSAHYQRKDEWHARKIRVTEELAREEAK